MSSGYSRKSSHLRKGQGSVPSRNTSTSEGWNEPGNSQKPLCILPAEASTGMQRQRADHAVPGAHHHAKSGGVVLSGGERMAEEIYYGAISRKFTFRECILMSKQLEFECSVGASYLRWLLARGDEWPGVG